MVNVADKAVTIRTARARASVALPPEAAAMAADGEIATRKGPVFPVAALTIYDMLKSVSRGMVIRQARLLEKTGGKSDNANEQGG